MIDTIDNEHLTRLRLLNAAGEVFAEKGFRAATVREICRAAGANVASVNYHFGDKQRLYSEVLRFAHACAMQKNPPQAGDDADPEDRLREFVSSFLRRVFDEGRPAWHEKLMSREMVEPTRALDELVKQDLQPRYVQLHSIIRGIIGPRADEKLVKHCGQSVIAQCVFYYHARPMLQRLDPTQKFDPATIEERADYICRFSIAAMQSLTARAKLNGKHQALSLVPSGKAGRFR